MPGVFAVGAYSAFGLHRAIAANMADLDAALFHHPSHQQKAMTHTRVFLAAHDRHAIVLDALEQPLDADQKVGAFGDSVVEHVTGLIVKLVTRRAATQLIPHKHILQSCRNNRRLQLFAIELGRVRRIRLSPHVGQHLNPVLPQQRHKRFQLMVGMSNRVQRQIWFGRMGHEG